MKNFNPDKELNKIKYRKRNKIVLLCFLMIVVSIISYSFALYQVRHTKRIIYTTVSDFKNTKDLELAVYLNGEKVDKIPEKNSGEIFGDLICENGNISSTWDNKIWGLKIISTILLPNKCNAYFVSKEKSQTFTYTGNVQKYTVLNDGLYKIELWGAEGGSTTNYKGGKGAYTKGVIFLNKNTNLFIYVGSKGVNSGSSTPSQTFNSGGIGKELTYGGYGGGSTDIRLEQGTTWNDFESLKSRIMVAAGGGSANERGDLYGMGNGGYAGGIEGGIGISTGRRTADNHYVGTGGTQIKGGDTVGYNVSNIEVSRVLSGNFGQGGTGQHSGGGSGYYGGGGSYHGGAGGGSSFISGHPGCNAINENSAETEITHTGQSIHYSKYAFSNTLIIDGEGYYWTDARQTYIGMPTYDGSDTMEGNSGNGYAKITYLGLA